jgi:hypothetical protein
MSDVVCRKFRVTVKMKEPWIITEQWAGKPTTNNVLEWFIDELMAGKLDHLLEVTIEEVRRDE